MFNLISQSIQAYNQVGFFIGAIICLGLGGLILASSLYWRVHAIRATGTIVGVIDRGGMYTAVYRYTSPDGQNHEAKSDTSTSSTRGKETGRVVSLLISAHNPSEARVSNDALLDFIGILLIAPGLWFGYTALTAYPVTWMTWIMAAIIIVYLGERAHRVFIPKGERLSIADWRRRHGLGDAAAIDAAEIKPIEQILATPEVQQKLETQTKNNKRAAPIVAAFALVLLGAGVYQARDIARLEGSGIRAEGEVVRLVGESSSGGHYNYYAIVRYKTEKNASVEFKDNIGSNPPAYRPGDKVSVLYLPENPRGQAIIDRGLFWNWAIPGLLFLSAALLVWLLLFMLRSGASAKLKHGLAVAT